jgi:predicted  nucleic acid-binding Zn-ribbon protein
MAEKPLFIKLEGYNDLTDMLNMVKVKIAEAKDSISRIDQLRQEEEAELDLWSKELEEVEKKMSAIDSDLMAARE